MGSVGAKKGHVKPNRPPGDSLFSDQFVAVHGEDHRHDHRYGKRGWRRWDRREHRWRQLPCPPGAAMAEIIVLHSGTNKEGESNISKFDRASFRRGALEIVSEELDHTDWDRQPRLLGLADGMVVDLETGWIRPQLREDYISRSTGVYPADDEGDWADLVDNIGCHDPTWTDYIGAVATDCAIGELGAHMVHIAHGPPATGKDTIFTSIQRALGDYATTLPSEYLLAKQHQPHPAWLADLADKRMVLSSEVPPGAQWNAPLVSLLTGGGETKARFMRENDFRFRPYFRMVILCNDLPMLAERSAGLRRRVQVIPFVQTFGSAMDRKIAEYFQGDGRKYVLRWIINRASTVLARDVNNRYPHCERIHAATTEYLGMTTPFETWRKQFLIPKPDGAYHVDDAYQSFNDWSMALGTPTLTKRAFGIALGRVMSPQDSQMLTIDGKRLRGYRGFAILGVTVNDVAESKPDTPEEQASAWLAAYGDAEESHIKSIADGRMKYQ